MSRTVTALLHQGLVELPASTRMNSSPAIFTVILQTGNISAEEWSELPPATGPLTFITQLIVQDIWLDFHLQPRTKERGLCAATPPPRARGHAHRCLGEPTPRCPGGWVNNSPMSCVLRTRSGFHAHRFTFLSHSINRFQRGRGFYQKEREGN